MRQFTLNMNIKYQRPIVELKTWHNFEALLDTGAFFPVWTADETILEMLGGTFLRKDITFGGFGGRTKGNLYKLQSMVSFFQGERLEENKWEEYCQSIIASTRKLKK